MSKKRIRPLGDIWLDMEKLILEAVTDHGLQLGDVVGNLFTYWDAHLPNDIEEYVEDGTSPVRYYGHIDGLFKLANHYKKLMKKK